MPRTPTLKAAAASLGLMAGFVIAPADVAPLERSLEPYAVAVAWHGGGGPSPELPVAGVQVDDWGGRLSPTPAPAERVEKRRVRTPEPRRPAPTRRQQVRLEAERVQREMQAYRELATEAQRAERELRARREMVLRDMDRAAAAFGVERNECPRHARRS